MLELSTIELPQPKLPHRHRHGVIFSLFFTDELVNYCSEPLAPKNHSLLAFINVNFTAHFTPNSSINASILKDGGGH
jgi:hypothetical protein